MATLRALDYTRRNRESAARGLRPCRRWRRHPRCDVWAATLVATSDVSICQARARFPDSRRRWREQRGSRAIVCARCSMPLDPNPPRDDRRRGRGYGAKQTEVVVAPKIARCVDATVFLEDGGGRVPAPPLYRAFTRLRKRPAQGSWSSQTPRRPPRRMHRQQRGLGDAGTLRIAAPYLLDVSPCRSRRRRPAAVLGAPGARAKMAHTS